MKKKELVIYRCLPFKVWHQPFEAAGGEWHAGGYRYECSCPYGRHTDIRFLDYKDPLHLEKILSLKKGTKLLTYYSWRGMEHVALHTFNKVEFYDDFIRLLFFEKLDVSDYGGTGEQFTPLRLIAVVKDSIKTTAFGKNGGINVFIGELSKISSFSIKEIKKYIEELDAVLIPAGLKISTVEITENMKKTGRLAPIFW